MGLGRRRLVGLIGASLAAAAITRPLPAQKRPYYRIAFISGGETRYTRAFFDGLRELGYEEGRHYALIERYYGGDRAKLSAMADELVALRPDVIVAGVSSVAALLKSKTPAIPIVMATAIDPVGEGLAESLARPGGNVTGLTSLSQTLHGKLVEFAHLLMPRAKRMAFVVNPDHVLAKDHEAVARRAARGLALEIVPLQVRARWEVAKLPEILGKQRVDALIVSADATLFGLRAELVKAGLDAGVPTISVLSEFAEPGALATYGHDLAGNFRGAARYVDRILKGARPGELPIEQPTEFELVVNVKTAKALRITIPRSVLLRADRVVE